MIEPLTTRLLRKADKLRGGLDTSDSVTAELLIEAARRIEQLEATARDERRIAHRQATRQEW